LLLEKISGNFRKHFILRQKQNHVF